MFILIIINGSFYDIWTLKASGINYKRDIVWKEVDVFVNFFETGGVLYFVTLLSLQDFLETVGSETVLIRYYHCKVYYQQM